MGRDQMAFEFATPAMRRTDNGQFMTGKAIPASAEVATVWRGEFLSPISLPYYPNLSEIIRFRSNGRGFKLYDQMWLTDADLSGLFTDLFDDILHYPYVVRPADGVADAQKHADFINFAIGKIPQWQDVQRHFLDAYPRGFSVSEKIYQVETRGKYAGAVTIARIQDKPQRWFQFGPNRELLFRNYDNPFPGTPVPAEKFIVLAYGSTNFPYGIACFDDCYFPWLMRHHGLKLWGIYVEKFAQPTAVARYPWSNSKSATAINKENLEKSLAVLQAMQGDNSIAVPEGIVIELLESKRNGIVSYDQYMTSLFEMLSRRVTGQIMTSMGNDGGSHALAKVHESKEGKRVQALAVWLATCITQSVVVELIDRNFGPQDAYPSYQILAKPLDELQSEATVEQMQIANGHSISKKASAARAQIVAPTGPMDILMPSATAKPSQVIPVPVGFSAGEKLNFAAYPGVRSSLVNRALAEITRRDSISSDAKKKAKKGIKSLVSKLTSSMKGMKPADVTLARISSRSRPRILPQDSARRLIRCSETRRRPRLRLVAAMTRRFLSR